MMHMFRNLVLLIAYFGMSTITLGQDKYTCEIKWDDWGIPHIKGQSDEDVFYGFGWAQMKAHGNLILEAFGKSRGRAAEYWGGSQNLSSDELIRKLNIPKRASQWYDAQEKEIQNILSAFVAGMNDYCTAHPESISNDLKIVFPITVTDPLTKLQLSYHLKVAAFAMQPQAEAWKNAGSNAWAIAPSKTENGNSMLMFQPHPPWFEDYLFFEAHLKSNHLNIYGISLLGSPSIAMGFNDNLGWGLTFNQADAMDLIELDIKNHHYLKDGEWKAFEVITDSIKIKQEDQLNVHKIVIKKSDFGFLIEEKDGKGLALRISGLDRPFFTQQFIKMAKAKNLTEFEKAMEMLQLPLQNIIYADKQGSIFYLYNGIIPKRPNGDMEIWSGVIPSSKEGALVTSYVDYQSLPKITNPISGFLANSNNGPWSSTYPFLSMPPDYPSYITAKPGANFDFRAMQSLHLLLSKPKFTFEDIEQLQSSTHSALADIVIDELVTYALQSDDVLLKEVAAVLGNWDRKLDSDSKGAVLFTNWYFTVRKLDLFSVQFAPDNALHTPNTLTTVAKAKLLDAAQQTRTKHGQLDVSFGEVYQINHGGKNYKGGLGLGELGCFNAGFYRPSSEKAYTLLGGTAYSAVVEFGPRIRAKGILSYGNASQNSAPVLEDQISLLLDRRLRPIWFYDDEIDENILMIEQLVGD